MTTKTTTKTKKVSAISAVTRMHEMEERQNREGFSHGYIGNEVRREKYGVALDRAVLGWLDAHGYDNEDAYQALNSRDSRHMGDALSCTSDTKEWARILNRDLWPTPAAMYAAFGQPKAGTATEQTNLRRARTVLEDFLAEAEKEENTMAVAGFKTALALVEKAITEAR